jgi:hypothetical protein
MIAGHFGLAAAVKSREISTPLWALMLATVWLDVVFVPLFMTHIETLNAVSDATGPYGGSIIYADYTHSLAGAIVLAALLGAAAAWIWGRRSGLVVALVAFSHWILDLLVHRADMPLLPGHLDGLPRMGLGLWRWPLGSVVAETLLVVVGSWLYWRAARHSAQAAGRGLALSTAAGVLALSFGLLVLACDFTGVLG